jgi:hypothetical protein
MTGSQPRNILAYADAGAVVPQPRWRWWIAASLILGLGQFPWAGIAGIMLDIANDKRRADPLHDGLALFTFPCALAYASIVVSALGLVRAIRFAQPALVILFSAALLGSLPIFIESASYWSELQRVGRWLYTL